MNKKISFLLVIGCMLALFFATGFTADAAGPDDVTVILDGEELRFDVRPSIINDRTMVPMRVVFEALGADIHWNGEDNIVTAVKGVTVVKAVIGSAEMFINGESLAMDVAPIIINGRTLVPVRFISEALGCGVGWDGDTNTVTISSDSSAVPEGFVAALAANRQKIVYMGHISQYGGKTYAAGYLCQPGWVPVEKAGDYISAFLIANGYVFYTESSGTGGDSTPMLYYALNGGGETFVDYTGNWGNRTYLCGDRLVYVRYGDFLDGYGDYAVEGLYVLDTKTLNKSKIMDIKGDDAWAYQVISFDDKYVYICKTDFEEYTFLRAAWDGTAAEKIQEFEGLSNYDAGTIKQLFKTDSTYGGGYYCNEIKSSYKNAYGTFESDEMIGICAAPIEKISDVRHYPVEANRVLCVSDGFAFYYDDAAVYKLDLANGAIVKLADWNKKATWAGGGVVIDGILYFKSSLDVDYDTESENSALWRVPVNGGVMEITGSKWFES